MKKTVFFMLVAVVLFGLLGCAQAASGQEVIQSDKPRDTSPTVDKTDLV